VAVEQSQSLYHLACAARESAYAPYSGFTVGAAVTTEDGQTYIGVNIENASYGLSICAERVAVFRAVADGARRITAIALAGPGDDVSPCGACRQVLAEFAGDDLPVTFLRNGKEVTRTLGELLPETFRLAKPAE
jgi:cytidine deaminase